MKCPNPKCKGDKVQEDYGLETIYRCMECNKIGLKIEFEKSE